MNAALKQNNFRLIMSFLIKSAYVFLPSLSGMQSASFTQHYTVTCVPSGSIIIKGTIIVGGGGGA